MKKILVLILLLGTCCGRTADVQEKKRLIISDYTCNGFVCVYIICDTSMNTEYVANREGGIHHSGAGRCR
jgi:hypothetical protein